MPSPDYLQASKKCDIVMKGGVTSGIVYPKAVCRLATEYRFQSIGGTSAGAIAAALTAAAEYARRQGRSVFDDLAGVPAWLGDKPPSKSDSNLFNLFQPQPGVRSLFRIAASILIKGWGPRLIKLGAALWLDLLVGGLPGLAVILLGFKAHPVWTVLLGGFIVIAGAVVAAAIGIIARVARLPRFRFGLCTGYASPEPGKPAALVEWLNTQINSMAGLPLGHPLTFGDLKRAGVNLRMITTCLTFGRPYTLPFESGEFYYAPAEMRDFMPPEVISWMEEHPATISPHGEPVDSTGLKSLPSADDLPIVFAARLSLSFPILFCALPLYAVDWTRRRRATDEPVPAARVPGDALAPDEVRKPEPVWFSDGGICSNFPLHLFDEPLPRWPTFALNLRDLRPDRDTRVWIPQSNRSGIAHLWTRLNTSGGLGSAVGLLSAILDAARNWMDNLQTMVPGYRDRIAHIYLTKDEGGLNLNMPEQAVNNIAAYGVQSADKLIDHFIHGTDNGSPTVMTWDNHRWIRCRSTLALLEAFLGNFHDSLHHPEPGDRSYDQLVKRGAKDPPTSYPLTEPQRECASQVVELLDDAAAELTACELETGQPRPVPELRIRPKF